jgi:hypothetical protein
MREATDTTSVAFVPQTTDVAVITTEPHGPLDGTSSGGFIFASDERPSVAEVLAPYRVLLAGHDRHADIVMVEGRTIVPSVKRGAEAIVTAALTGAIAAVGILLLISTVVSGHIRVNPAIALSLALGGLGLTATLATVIKHAGDKPSE